MLTVLIALGKSACVNLALALDSERFIDAP